jgi:hypothetical protein
VAQFFIDAEYESDERYDIAKFMNYENNEYDPVTSRFLEELVKLPIAGTFKISYEEYRPDLISYKIYKDTQYWWILIEYNKLMSFEDLTAGIEINFPSLTDLEELYFNLKALDSARS